MKMYSPGNCFCTVGFYWLTSKSAPNPGETGNVTETIFGFCTGILTPFILTPSESSPLGVDVEGKKVLYRRGSGQEIWTRDLLGTTALLFGAGDIYDYSDYITDIVYNESLGFSSVRLTGLAPYTSSVASFDNASGNFVEGPYTGGPRHATDSSGNIYTYFFTQAHGLGVSLIEVKMYKNGVEYATLNAADVLTHSYGFGDLIVVGSSVYVTRGTYPNFFIENKFTRIVEGGDPNDHEDLFLINTIGTPTDNPNKKLSRMYYNNSNGLIDSAMENGGVRTIVRFNLDLSRNSTLVTTWNPGNELDSFVFKDG